MLKTAITNENTFEKGQDGTQEVSGGKVPLERNVLSDLVTLFDTRVTLDLVCEKRCGSRKSA